VDGSKPEFIVHPSLGKWLISLGIAIFGDDSFGWRFTTALVGVISVVVIYLVALRLFDSKMVALLAAFLLAIDGLAIVMSRTALLDNFLALFALLAFWSLVEKQYLLMGIALGAAVSTKWSGLYFLVVFLALALLIEMRSRGIREMRIRDGIRILIALPITGVIYLLSWTGWLISDRGWARTSDSNPLIALWNFHREIYGFHSNLDAEHPYRSHPWSWLVMGRPTSFFYESPKGCGEEQCSQEVLALGNPLIWWFGTIALAILIGYFLSRRDRKSLLILSAFAAGFLPWFLFPDRTMFTFYAISILPFLILAIAYLARELELHHPRARAVLATASVATFLLFLYFLPIYVAEVITYDQWQSRMWLESWI
jgi:dolichyl-phosphate-mannose--protein O-mannosyl transferase